VRSSYEVLRRAGYFGVSTTYVGKWSVEMGRAITSGRAFELKIASMVWTKAEAVALGLALASAGCRVHTIVADTVTGEKLACLTGCAEGWQTVKTLKIHCNALGPTGAASLAPALAKMIHLKTLKIYDNDLGPTGAASLAPALAKMIHLKTLIIYNNDLGPTGAAGLAPALAKMIHLKALDIEDNDLDAPSQQLIKDAVPAGCTDLRL
jgi:hypothetical protein